MFGKTYSKFDIRWFKKSLDFTVATATSDTWATEFGKLSKSKPISITTFQPIEHGLSGGITMIGLFGSILGASIIGLAAYLLIKSKLGLK